MDATIAAISTAMSASGIGIVRYQWRKCYGCDREDLSIPKTEKKIFVQSSAIPFIMDLSMMEKKL